MNAPAAQPSRPPLWLAIAALVAGWAALYDVVIWFILFIRQPIHPDFRIFYVAAEAGLRYGWASIYDLTILRSLSSSFPTGQNYINPALPFINPPVFAWLIAPLTALPLPVAYAIWCAVSLAALVWAWHIAAPYAGLRKLALLPAALALWPVLDAFFFGQPTLVIVGLLATSWWLCSKDRPLAAGAALAMATALKPHTVILIPLALLVSGRYRPFLSWAAVCSLLAVACVIALGPAGLNNALNTLEYGQTDTGQAHYTLAYVVGTGPVSYALEGIQGIAALVIAWRRRADLNIVFALGILGSLVFAFHLHQYDYVTLILAAWLVLRTGPPTWHRLWLLLGVVPMLAISLGNPLPQLLWDFGWLVILALGAFRNAGAPISHDPVEAAV
ncbi:MAG TPA: glycosyltransferase family 87 protein [Candidatus Dormibacteraeota bacterium]|nr:glycosyltransferase family 87 protein [Candidatus Dormibacteraeota bacterium]